MPKLFYAAVNSGFIVAAAEDTSTILRRIMVGDLRVHYSIRCSSTGQEPATHYAANGVIEDREAQALQQYYDGISRNNIDAWLLSVDRSQLLWTKKDGVLDPYQTGQTFEQFLASFSPSLQIIEAAADVQVTALVMSKVPFDDRGQFNAAMNSLVRRGPMAAPSPAPVGRGPDWIAQALSPSGDLPATDYIGFNNIAQDKVEEFKHLFPYNPSDTTHAYLLHGDVPFWSNIHGDDVPREPLIAPRLARTLELKPIR